MDNQLEKNWKVYNRVKEQYEAKHWGKTVLLHDGEVVDVYNDSGDAYKIGCDKYGLGNFTTQTIGEKPISLGIFTLCLPR